jgi:hypothetical protein
VVGQRSRQLVDLVRAEVVPRRDVHTPGSARDRLKTAGLLRLGEGRLW